MLRPGRAASTLPTTSTGSNGSSSSSFSYATDYSTSLYSSSSSGSYGSQDYYGSGSFDNNHNSKSSSSNNNYSYAYDSNEFKDKPIMTRYGSHKQSIVKIAQKPWVISAIVALVFVSLTCKYRSQYNYLLKALQVTSITQAINSYEALQADKRKISRDLASKQQQYEKRIIRLESSHDETKKERDELKKKIAQVPASRDKAWISQVVRLQHVISQEARRSVIEKYGYGPHKVRMYTLLPNEKREKSFVIELASVDLVPHAVHVFLEQVDYNLWDNTYFYLNGPHVLQAGPQVEYAEGEDWLTEEQERERAVGPFIEAGLEALAYPEYSLDYPHEQWTVGFAGRPGGPDIYINKMNNTESHGPGGQEQYELDEYADSCFGKIVEGMDVIQQLTSLKPILDDPDWQWFFDDPVLITRAEIIGYHSENSTSAHPTIVAPAAHDATKMSEETIQQIKAYVPSANAEPLSSVDQPHHHYHKHSHHQ